MTDPRDTVRHISSVSQALKDRMRASPGWSRLDCVNREALDIFANTIGAILDNAPNPSTTWWDFISTTAANARDSVP